MTGWAYRRFTYTIVDHGLLDFETMWPMKMGVKISSETLVTNYKLQSHAMSQHDRQLHFPKNLKPQN